MTRYNVTEAFRNSIALGFKILLYSGDLDFYIRRTEEAKETFF